MVKENQKMLNHFNVISDAIAGFIAITASYLTVFHLLKFEKNFPLSDYIKICLIFIPVQLLIFGCMGLYDSFRNKRFAKELGQLFCAFALNGIFIVALLYIIKIMDFSRLALVVFVASYFTLTAVKRFILHRVIKSLRKKGYNKKFVIIIGSNLAARDYLETIRTEKNYGYECAGYISDNRTLPAKWLGSFGELQEVLEKRPYDEAVCALSASETDLLGSVVEACEQTGTKISVIPTIYRYMSPASSIDVVGNIPMMNIRRIPLDNIGNAMLKRTVDIIGSAVLLVLTAPVMLVSMAVIKITMGGRVIFKQKRMGLNKKAFTMYKLKSMRDSDSSDTAWSTDSDPRKTRFGAVIRKFSIDELPQLVNVLKGDMSLVGPRPEIPYYVESFKDKIPMYMIRHQVKPGITGLAQINGFRGDTSIVKRIEFDVQYIENWSVFLDISILLKTAVSGFINKEKIKAPKPAENEEEKTVPEEVKI